MNLKKNLNWRNKNTVVFIRRMYMGFSDELGNRMKEYYEAVPKTKLMRRTP